jgi:hypothetical protein
MWYDVWFYAAGGALGVIEALRTHPWRPTGKYAGKYTIIFSIIITIASFISSLMGEIFGAIKICFEGNTNGVWVAIVACIILAIINLTALGWNCKRYKQYERFKKLRKIMTKSCSNLTECLKYGDISGLETLKHQAGRRYFTSYSETP